MFCRLRRKWCKPGLRPDACKDCGKFYLECNGRGEQRPSWLKEPFAIEYVKKRIKDRTSYPDRFKHVPRLSMTQLRWHLSRRGLDTISSLVHPMPPTDGLCDVEVSSACTEEPVSTMISDSNDFYPSNVSASTVSLSGSSLRTPENRELEKFNGEDAYSSQKDAYCDIRVAYSFDQVGSEENAYQHHGAGPYSLDIYDFISDGPYDEPHHTYDEPYHAYDGLRRDIDPTNPLGLYHVNRDT